MAETRDSVYLEFHAKLERANATLAQRRAQLYKTTADLQADLANKQQEVSTKTAAIDEQIRDIQEKTAAANVKLALRSGPAEGSEFERLKSEASSAIYSVENA